MSSSGERLLNSKESGDEGSQAGRRSGQALAGLIVRSSNVMGFALSIARRPVLDGTELDPDRGSAHPPARRHADGVGDACGFVPKSAYLVGGTAVAVHLQHRVSSRDLDFYLSEAEDLRVHHELLESKLRNEWAASLVRSDTLKGFLGRTTAEFFHAINETPVAPLTFCGGLAVASLKDLMAMKLGAITRRGALRDYLDLMEIEKRAGLSTEEGIGFYCVNIQLRDNTRPAVAAVILARRSGRQGDEQRSIPPV